MHHVWERLYSDVTIDSPLQNTFRREASWVSREVLQPEFNPYKTSSYLQYGECIPLRWMYQSFGMSWSHYHYLKRNSSVCTRKASKNAKNSEGSFSLAFYAVSVCYIMRRPGRYDKCQGTICWNSYLFYSEIIHMGVTYKKSFGVLWTKGRTLGTTIVSCFFEQTVPAISCPWVAVLCVCVLWIGNKES